MTFSIISPTSQKKMQVSWLEIQTLEGNLIIQSGHAPIIIVLAPNKELTIQSENGTTTTMTIPGGILEANREKATLLLANE